MKSCWSSFAVLVLLVCCSLAVQPAARAEQNATAAEPSGELQTELRSLYLAGARTQDLLSVMQPAKWKAADADRSTAEQKISAAEAQLRTLEHWRYQLEYHPDNADYAQNMVTALGTALADVREISGASRPYQQAAAAQLGQAADDLSKLSDKLTSELTAAFPGKFATATASAPAPGNPAPPKTPAPAVPARSLSSKVPQPINTQPVSRTMTVTHPSLSAPQVGPEQTQKALLNIYFAAARISDLLSMVQPGTWKATAGERAATEAQLQSVRTGLANLEKWRYQFSYHLQDTNAAENTVKATAALLSQVQQIRNSVRQFEGASAAGQFAQPENQLASLKNVIAGYVAGLHARYQKELAGVSPGSSSLSTEHISGVAAPPPVQYLPGFTPPLTFEQVKAILYKIYVSVYRIHDLLTQEHPTNWKAPEQVRTADGEVLAGLLTRIDDVQKWRGLFSEYPDNMYDAFQSYRSVEEVIAPLVAFSEGVSQYESATTGSDYSRQAGELQARLGDLLPYIGFILKHESNNIGLYQSDLAACQNKLSYAMHGLVGRAVPMKNIVPVFKGRRVRRAKRNAAREQDHHQVRKIGSSR